MLDERGLKRLMDFFQEALFVVDRSGLILRTNGAGEALIGGPAQGRRLTDISATPADRIAAYLKRCAGSSNPVVGALALRDAEGEVRRLQAKGALLDSGPEFGDRIVLRCTAAAFREFSQLSEQVSALNEENRRLLRSRAILEEALSQRELMLRELQHRVRNQTQMMLSMVSAARREAPGEELSVFLDGLRRRLLAIAAVQQLMYTSESFETVSARALIEQICGSISETWPEGAKAIADCADAWLPNDAALAIALLLNELLSNALKHGLAYGEGTVKVSLALEGADLVLTVSDPGPGMAEGRESRQAGSGLTLVRGLCRQIGGAFSMRNEGGTHSVVRFPRPDTNECGKGSET